MRRGARCRQTRDVAGEAVGGRAQGERRETRLEERTRAEESAHLLDSFGIGIEAGRLGRVDAAAESEARDARAALVEHVGEVSEHAVGACLLGGRGVGRAVVEHGVPLVFPVGLGGGAVFPLDGAERAHVVAAVRGEHVEPLHAAEPDKLVVERQVAHPDAAHQHGDAWIDLLRGRVAGLEQLDELRGRRLLPEEAVAGQVGFVPELEVADAGIAAAERRDVVVPGGHVARRVELRVTHPADFSQALRRGGVPGRRAERVHDDTVETVTGLGGGGERVVHLLPVVLAPSGTLDLFPVETVVADERMHAEEADQLEGRLARVLSAR